MSRGGPGAKKKDNNGGDGEFQFVDPKFETVAGTVGGGGASRRSLSRSPSPPPSINKLSATVAAATKTKSRSKSRSRSRSRESPPKKRRRSRSGSPPPAAAAHKPIPTKTTPNKATTAKSSTVPTFSSATTSSASSAAATVTKPSSAATASTKTSMPLSSTAAATTASATTTTKTATDHKPAAETVRTKITPADLKGEGIGKHPLTDQTLQQAFMETLTMLAEQFHVSVPLLAINLARIGMFNAVHYNTSPSDRSGGGHSAGGGQLAEARSTTSSTPGRGKTGQMWSDQERATLQREWKDFQTDPQNMTIIDKLKALATQFERSIYAIVCQLTRTFSMTKEEIEAYQGLGGIMPSSGGGGGGGGGGGSGNSGGGGGAVGGGSGWGYNNGGGGYRGGGGGGGGGYGRARGGASAGKKAMRPTALIHDDSE